ncbi:MAG: 5-oxoprolinase subunit PxpA [Gammaproteobacteria bacterium]
MHTIRRTSIDLNSDLGEGCGTDAPLLEIVSSANIACGAHAGDAETMRHAVDGAVRNHVSIGAHVSYPDREHFGRRDMDMPSRALTASVSQQLRALDSIARAAGTQVSYVKPHGALYNRMADDADTADAVIDAITAFDAALALLTLPGSVAMQRAQIQGLNAVGEAFTDRAYTAAARLVPRAEVNAIINDVAIVARRAVDMATIGKVVSLDGKSVSIQARSLCVHGDTPGAVALARAVRVALEQAGVIIRPFA